MIRHIWRLDFFKITLKFPPSPVSNILQKKMLWRTNRVIHPLWGTYFVTPKIPILVGNWLYQARLNNIAMNVHLLSVPQFLKYKLIFRPSLLPWLQRKSLTARLLGCVNGHYEITSYVHITACYFGPFYNWAVLHFWKKKASYHGCWIIPGTEIKGHHWMCCLLQCLHKL